MPADLPERPVSNTEQTRVIAVDYGRCAGHGRCYLVAPNLLAPEDAGDLAVALDQAVTADDDDLAREGDHAIESCPETALSWTKKAIST